MAIKTSGPISINNIVAEFGGTAPHSLSEYYRGGQRVPNTNANIAIALSGNPISLNQFYGARKEIILTYLLQGAGGAGGNGLADGNGDGVNNPGQKSGIMTRARFDSLVASNGGTFPSNPADSNYLAVAAGGAGGSHGAQGQITGGTGAASSFGAGGPGGAENSAAPNPTWGHWGAGGGGGGGDDGSTSYLNLYGSDAAGNAGTGAGAGERLESLISIDVDVDYVVIAGGGGNPQERFNYKGGRGVPGFVSFTLSTDANSTTYQVVNPNNGSQDAHYIVNTIRYLRIRRDGTVYLGVTPP
jgi:hypothetical protein